MADGVKVSVIIAIYNGQKYLKETIESILNQSYKSFEIIAIVNCSSDATLQILKDFNDKRIKIYKTDICQLAFNLNYGLQVSRGEYIARIDADDVAQNNRLEKQLQCFEENNYDVIGSNIIMIDKNSSTIGEKKYPENNNEIRKQIFYSSPLAHPSVMYKKKIVLQNGGYLNGKMSEDYDLWIRLMRDKNIKFYNIQENLTKYRIHSNQAKGNKLAYYEICGYMMRETLHQRSFKFFLGFLIYLFKALIK